MGALATALFTPIARKWALSIGAVVKPDERRVHTKPTVTLGGIAMFYGLLAAVVAAALRPGLRPVLSSSSEIWGVLIGALVVTGVGAIDDVRDISPPAKVAGQALAGSILSLFGVTMLYFRLWPSDHFVSLGRDLAPLVTVLWVVGMANAINLIDGLDGLAAGIVAIGAASMFIFSFGFTERGVMSPTGIAPLLAAATAGICIGFLPHNFHPAKIFMGDGGAMMLGFMLAASTIVIGGRTPDIFPGRTFLFFGPIIIPIVILGVPIIDMLMSIVRRVSGGRSFAMGDKEHLHHRLLRLGHGHRRSVLLLYAWSALLSAIVLVPAFTGKGNVMVLGAAAAAALGLFTIFHPGIRDRVTNGSGPALAPGAPEGEGGTAATAGVPGEVAPAARDAGPGGS